MADLDLDPVARAAVSTTAFEIAVHETVLWLVLAPLGLIIFPFVMFVFSAGAVDGTLYLDLQRVHATTPLSNGYVFGTTGQWVVATLAVVAIVVYALVRERMERRSRAAMPMDRRYNALKEDQGIALKAFVTEMWSRIAGRSEPVPAIRWFLHADVVARALHIDRMNVIAISAGLWHRLNRDDLAGRIIVLHEMAHLRYRDPLRFARLESLIAVSRMALRGTFVVLCCVLLWMVLHGVVFDVLDRRGAVPIAAHLVMVAVIGALALAAVPLTYVVLRRYAGFLTMLVELRADVTAARWGEGLARAVEIFTADKAVHQSTWLDRSRSIFGLNPTHLSETERIELLRDPDRLLSPKLQYFALSLALPVCFPLNGLTPLLYGGIFDLALVLLVIVAAEISFVGTPAVAAFRGGPALTVRRTVLLAAAIASLPVLGRFDLYTFSYGIQAIAAEIGVATSAAALAGIDNPLEVLSSSVRDVGRQVVAAFQGGALPAGMLLSFALVLVLGALVRRSRHRAWERVFFVLLISGVALGTVIEAFDPRRGDIVVGSTAVQLVLGSWDRVASEFPPLRFALAPVLAVLVAVLHLLAPRRRSRQA